MAKAATLITGSTVVRGRLEGSEDLEIQGRVEGQIALDGALTIDSAGRADATVNATSIYVHGILIGDATATDTIHLTGESIVVGDLAAPRVIVDDGAKVRGLIDMGGDASPAKSSRSTKTKTSRPRSAPAEAETVEEPELPAAASTKKVNVKKRQ